MVVETSASLRIGFNVPKYPLWMGFGVVAHFARRSLPPPLGASHSFAYWPALAVASNIGILAVGWKTRPRADQGNGSA